MPCPEGGAQTAIYVFGFIAAGAMPELPQPMADDGRIGLLAHGRIAALITQVPACDYTGPGSAQNLADPEWLMPRICRHEAVVEAAMAAGPVFPARFATLYARLGSLTGFMAEHEDAISTYLGQVAGQQEWALTLTAALGDPVELAAIAAELWPEWADLKPGLRYLRLRRDRPVLLAAARERAAAAMPALIAPLAPHLTAHRPLPRAAIQPEHHVEAHALLARTGQGAILQGAVQALAAAHATGPLRIAITGPWPPYSFRPSIGGNSPCAAQ